MYAGVMTEKRVASWARARMFPARGNLESVVSLHKARICMGQHGGYASPAVQGTRRYGQQAEQHPGEDIQGRVKRGIYGVHR